jgi:hypothetical protein
MMFGATASASASSIRNCAAFRLFLAGVHV